VLAAAVFPLGMALMTLTSRRRRQQHEKTAL